MIRAVMKREKDGAALVTCEHNKCELAVRGSFQDQRLILLDNVDADMKL